MLVHAHPDDESILTGGVMAQAHLDGHRVVLITATRGEDGHGGAGKTAAGADVGAARSLELQRACEILGVDRQEFLGYTGSGHAVRDSEHDPRAFVGAPLAEVATRIGAVVQEERPDVVVTYTEDGTYAHRDHIRAHTATIAALDALAAEGWQPRKVYLHAVPRSFVTSTIAAAREAGIALPEEITHIEGIPDDEITTEVDVFNVLDRKLAACVAHTSQMHPGLPLATVAAQLFETAFGVERFVLARGTLGADRPEPSLFAGIA